MNTKAKGTNAERDLIHKFWANGFVAVRVAGSGSMKYPSPDLLASNGKKVLAIECKVIADTNKYFEKQEITDLYSFASKFGAEAWIAIKFKGEDWYFLSVLDLPHTENSFKISLDQARKAGIRFEEIVAH